MLSKFAPYMAMVVLCIFAAPFLATSASHPASPRRQATAVANGPKQKPVPLLYPKNLSIVPQSSEGGLWRTDGTFQSVMMLKNIPLNTTMSVTPVLYMADGTEYDLPPVQLDKAGVAMVNLNVALQNAPSNIQPHISTYGSAAIRYKWAWKDAVGASIRIGDDVSSLAYLTHLNANANETHDAASPQASQTLEGMWWKQEPGVSGFLAMTNTSISEVTANFQLFGSGESGTKSQTIVIAPHQTQLVELAPIWGQIDDSPNQGGIRVSYAGAKNALQIDGGLMDGAKGYSQKINLSAIQVTQPPATTSAQPNIATFPVTHSINLDSTGMMVGAQDANMQFPQGTLFAPYEVLRNTTNHPLQVQLTANYVNQAVPADASLGAINLAPQEVQQVDLKGLLATAGLGKYNGLMNLRTSYVGVLRDLLAEAGSLDQTMSYVFETPALIEAASGARILSYWNTVGDTDTMITLWNHSSQAQDFILTFYHQQGQYKLPIHLAANASQALSMAWLLKNGPPDSDGNVFPATITQGSAKLASANRETDRLQVSMHIGVFNVRTATCTCPCEYCDPYEGQGTVPDSIDEPDGVNTEFAAYVYLADGPVDVTATLSWDSSDSNVVTFSSDGNDGDAVSDGSGVADLHGTFDFGGNTFDANSGGDCNGGGEYQYESICGETTAGDFELGVTVTPTITGVSPTHGVAGTTVKGVIINGTGFGNASNTSVSVTGGISVQIVSVTNSDPNLNAIVANFVIPTGAAAGNNSITVAVTGGDNTTQQSNSWNFLVTVEQATLSLNTTGQVSSDDAGSSAYSAALGTTNLGSFFNAGGTSPAHIWRTGVEIVGTFSPNSFSCNSSNSCSISFTQVITSSCSYKDTNNGSTPFGTCISGQPDSVFNSATSLMDTDPLSGGSDEKVYALDAPGTGTGSGDPIGTIQRRRDNFTVTVSLNGTPVATLNWFSRHSVIKTSSGDVLKTDISGDNSAGTGSTATSWNLM